MLLPKPRFAVIIPVYNHHETVRAVVGEALALNLPLYVVDDGSVPEVGPLIADSPRVRVLRHPVNRGKGAALLTGFAAAVGQADYAVTIDADGQHRPEDAHALMAAIPAGTRPIVVGHRMRMDQPNTPWTSRFGRGFSNFWVRIAGGPWLGDTQSGFRIYPLPEVLQLPVAARRYQFELEILVQAARRGIAVLETKVPVIYPPPEERISHFHPLMDFLRNTGMFARLITRRIFGGKQT